jgi:hypothetical protein
MCREVSEQPSPVAQAADFFSASFETTGHARHDLTTSLGILPGNSMQANGY